MLNPYSHVDQRVPDLDAGVSFYGAIMPAIGFPEYRGGEKFRTWATGEGPIPRQAFFGITEDANHRPNANRVAFWAEDRATVDRLARVVREAGAQNVSGPKPMPEYSNDYYAVFFDDPWGNPLEIVHMS